MFEFDLTLGLPNTNQNGLSDALLMMAAGHYQWTAIARAIGRPLSELRTLNGGRVYATFYFIETRFPADRPISTFTLDDQLRFTVSLRAFKNLAVEGRLSFDHRDRMMTAGADHPWIRFGNIFITPEAGNSLLRIAPPANADFSQLDRLPNSENPHVITRRASETGRLDVIGDDWTPIDVQADFAVRYAIDMDRDTNGAGLVYFANYVAFMDSAERMAMLQNASAAFTDAEVAGRALTWRRIAYYGNVTTSDAVLTTVSLFRPPDGTRALGVRYVIRRESDGQLICRSEAIKVLPAR